MSFSIVTTKAPQRPFEYKPPVLSCDSESIYLRFSIRNAPSHVFANKKCFVSRCALMDLCRICSRVILPVGIGAFVRPKSNDMYLKREGGKAWMNKKCVNVTAQKEKTSFVIFKWCRFNVRLVELASTSFFANFF